MALLAARYDSSPCGLVSKWLKNDCLGFPGNLRASPVAVITGTMNKKLSRTSKIENLGRDIKRLSGLIV
jgi:hypothetical protein